MSFGPVGRNGKKGKWNMEWEIAQTMLQQNGTPSIHFTGWDFIDFNVIALRFVQLTSANNTMNIGKLHLHR